MTVAALIPTYRRWAHLLSTVRQLLGQTRVPDEIIIVDQTPEAEIAPRHLNELDRLGQRHPRIEYRHQPEPHVYRARNRAARVARCELLLYLDDDVLLDSKFVHHHVSIMEDHAVDAIVGRVTTKKPTNATFREPPLEMSPAEFAFSFNGFRQDIRYERVAYCAAGNFCVRRQALADIGGWDENILTYGDKDMGLRMNAMGKNIVYDPRPAMVHLMVPLGGTRLSDPQAPWSAWQRAVSIHYVAIRHLSGRCFWRFGLLRAARHTFLLRKNAVRPWRWLPEIWGFAKGYAIARKWVDQGVRSSYLAPVESTRSGSGLSARRDH